MRRDPLFYNGTPRWNRCWSAAWIPLLVSVLLVVGVGGASPIGAGFTFQGRLMDEGQPAAVRLAVDRLQAGRGSAGSRQ